MTEMVAADTGWLTAPKVADSLSGLIHREQTRAAWGPPGLPEGPWVGPGGLRTG
jgi:hypothetical protein